MNFQVLQSLNVIQILWRQAGYDGSKTWMMIRNELLQNLGSWNETDLELVSG